MRFTVSPDSSIPDRAVNSDIPRTVIIESAARAFSTVSLRGIEASDDRAVAGAINVASLVHGTVGYGGMRNSETVFLQLAAGEGSRYKMLSVIIPVAVWRQVAGTAEPGSFKGKIIRSANYAASCRE